MGKVTINSLKLRNFKAIKSFELTPQGKSVDIAGDNETGKTTLAAAFTWLLWGKDLQDRKDFEIKTLDKDNKPIPQLEHEVQCTIDIDGASHTLRRMYQEKWTKRRGEENAELTGHETHFWWNDVPLKLKEYSQKVEEVFGSEPTFKILTNPMFFNLNLKWEERREILTDIVGKVNDMDILTSESRFSSLVDKVTGKTMEEYEAQIKSRKKEIKSKLETIPDRLDEVDRMRPEQEPDYEQLNLSIKGLEEKIISIENQINDKSKVLENYYEVRGEWLKNINELKDKIRGIEQAATNDVQNEANKLSKDAYELKRKISDLEEQIKTDQEAIERNKKRAEEYKIKQDKLRARYKEESAKTLEIDESEFACPTCKRPYDAETAADIEAKMLNNFNAEQAKKLEEIRADGKQLGAIIDERKHDINYANEKIKELSDNAESLRKKLKEKESMPVSEKSVKDILSNNKEYQQAIERLEQLENNEPPKPKAGDTSELEAEKRKNQESLEELKKELTVKDQVARLNKREEELKEEEKNMAQQLSALEKDEYLIEQFTRKKVDAIEGKVNKLFPSVSFKLFEIQLNGALKETCQTLINGVPYSAANNAAQIQSGIEIINVLQNHYGIILPVFIDNAESITSYPGTEAQLIKLYVEKGVKSLTVK